MTRVTHATPAGTYAHTPGRNWEAFIPKDQPYADQCKDIAWQLVNENNDIRVSPGSIVTILKRKFVCTLFFTYYDIVLPI